MVVTWNSWTRLLPRVHHICFQIGMKTINQLPVYVCQSNCPFLPFSKETMQMKMIACHPRLILQKKNATIGCHFLMLPQEKLCYSSKKGKKILCATFLELEYNCTIMHQKLFSKNSAFNFIASMRTMPSRSSLVQALYASCGNF